MLTFFAIANLTCFVIDVLMVIYNVQNEQYLPAVLFALLSFYTLYQGTILLHLLDLKEEQEGK